MSKIIDMIGMLLLFGLPLALFAYITFRAIVTLLTGISEAIWPPKDERCDCVTQVEHSGFGFVGVAGTSYIPDRDCPKCNGTGKIDPKSPYANKPSPVRGRPPNPALVAATGAAAASIAAAAMRHDDWHDQYQRQLDDDRRSRNDMPH